MLRALAADVVSVLDSSHDHQQRRLVTTTLAAQLTSTTAQPTASELARRWQNTPTEPQSFDATVEQLQGRLPFASELGWGLIRIESQKHVNLIWHQANKLSRTMPEDETADLLGWGWIGLRAALRLYNPQLGFSFSTYACTRIIGSMRDGARSERPVPKRLGTFQRKVASVEAELVQSLGRTPTLEEVAQQVGADTGQLQVLQRTQTPASIDELTTAADGDSAQAPCRQLVADADIEEDGWRCLVRDDIDDALAALPAEEAEAVRLLVLEAVHPTEARRQTGVTARQMRQRKERGLKALQQQLGHWQPTVT